MSSKLKILIFGAGGFTGQHFARFVASRELTKSFQIIGVSRAPANGSSFPILTANLLEQGVVETVVAEQRPDYILNFVGSFSGESVDELYPINVGVSQRICGACHEFALESGNGLTKALFLGSAAEFGFPEKLPVGESCPVRPVSPYGLVKAIQTQVLEYYFRVHELPIVIARPFNIVGSGLSERLSIGSFASQINSLSDRGTLNVGNLESGRDFISISDCLDAYWRILMDGTPGESYNVCSGQSERISRVVNLLIESSGKRIIVKTDPTRFKQTDVNDIYGDCRKLKEELNWQPSPDLSETIAQMVRPVNETNVPLQKNQ